MNFQELPLTCIRDKFPLLFKRVEHRATRLNGNRTNKNGTQIYKIRKLQYKQRLKDDNLLKELDLLNNWLEDIRIRLGVSVNHFALLLNITRRQLSNITTETGILPSINLLERIIELESSLRIITTVNIKTNRKVKKVK